jgi:hypothetical protein
LSSRSQKDAANTAAAAQTQSSQLGIDEQRREFDLAQAEQRRQLDAYRQALAPYVNAGSGALTAQQNLVGVNGAAPQAAAIDAIKASPQFQALTQQGSDAILANASATGGLRGGNVQAALAQFQPQLLSQLIEQQYARLGGLTALGQNSAVGVGTAGINTGAAIAQGGLQTGANISNLLGQQGAAQAGSALASGRAMSSMYNAFGNSVGMYAGLNGLGGGPAYNATAARAATSAQQGLAESLADHTFAPPMLDTASLIGPYRF